MQLSSLLCNATKKFNCIIKQDSCIMQADSYRLQLIRKKPMYNPLHWNVMHLWWLEIYKWVLIDSLILKKLAAIAMFQIIRYFNKRYKMIR